MSGLDDVQTFSFSQPESPALSGFSPNRTPNYLPGDRVSRAAGASRWHSGSMSFLDLDQDMAATGGRFRTNSLTNSGSFSVSDREDGGRGRVDAHDDLFDFLFED